MTQLTLPQPVLETEPEAPTSEDLPYISGRLRLVFRLFALVMLLFTFQIYKLTILQGPEHRNNSENNFLLEKPLPAPRGRILDRLGRPLAVNETLYDVEMSRYRLPRREILNTLDRLAQLLEQPRLRGRAETVASSRPLWKPVLLARDLTMAQVLPVIEQQFRLPGVVVSPHFNRYYPTGEVCGPITGHVGIINPEQSERYLQEGYLPSEKVGQLNAELTFESILRGTPGLELVTRNAEGRPIARHVTRSALRGNTIKLSLDLELQRLAYALLEGWNGAIVVMDPRNGAVLAAAARPTYDPATPLRGSSFNKITQAKFFAPGSTFKIVTASAGLASGISPLDRAYCDGAYHLPGVRQRFPCHLKWGHEWQNMYDALQHSCNVFFYGWARRAGYEQMTAMARAYGFGHSTGFDLASAGMEAPGRVGAATSEPILLGNLLMMGIGQGSYISVTPIQVARAYSALCNGGVLYRPRIVKEIDSPQGALKEAGQPEVQGTLPLTEEQRGQIVEGLTRVVSRPGGTGSRTGFKPEWRVAGKTGTAETHRKKTDAWFIGFAPVEDPEVLVVVLVEEGGHGGETAAPLARQILAQYFGEPEPEIVPPSKEPKPVVAAD